MNNNEKSQRNSPQDQTRGNPQLKNGRSKRHPEGKKDAAAHPKHARPGTKYLKPRAHILLSNQETDLDSQNGRPFCLQITKQPNDARPFCATLSATKLMLFNWRCSRALWWPFLLAPDHIFLITFLLIITDSSYYQYSYYPNPIHFYSSQFLLWKLLENYPR